VGTRFSVKATSSAVNGEPSWKRTFFRSLNSQVSASIARHEVASPGTSFMFASRRISGSNTCMRSALFGVRLW
jgi:hypothetical protein